MITLRSASPGVNDALPETVGAEQHAGGVLTESLQHQRIRQAVGLAVKRVLMPGEPLSESLGTALEHFVTVTAAQTLADRYVSVTWCWTFADRLLILIGLGGGSFQCRRRGSVAYQRMKSKGLPSRHSSGEPRHQAVLNEVEAALADGERGAGEDHRLHPVEEFALSTGPTSIGEQCNSVRGRLPCRTSIQ